MSFGVFMDVGMMRWLDREALEIFVLPELAEHHHRANIPRNVWRAFGQTELVRCPGCFAGACYGAVPNCFLCSVQNGFAGARGTFSLTIMGTTDAHHFSYAALISATISACCAAMSCFSP